MPKKGNSKKKDVPATNPSTTYLEAQRLLQEWKEGYVAYDRIFTKKEEPRKAFSRIISGDLLEYLGNEYYWKRSPGEPMILYGKNTWNKKLRELGIVEICRIQAPDVWVGAGRYRIDWPEMEEEKEDAPTPILVSLYLYSVGPAAFDRFVTNGGATAYLASFYFEQDNAALLNDLAEERFESFV